MIILLLNQTSWYVGDLVSSLDGRPFGVAVDSTSVYTDSSFAIIRRHISNGSLACAKKYEYPNYTLKVKRVFSDRFIDKNAIFVWAISNNGLIFMKIDTTCNAVISKLYNFTTSETNLKIFKFTVSQNKNYMKIDTSGNIMFSKSISYQYDILDNSDYRLMLNDGALISFNESGNIVEAFKLSSCGSAKFFEWQGYAIFLVGGYYGYYYSMSNRIYEIFPPTNFIFSFNSQNRHLIYKTSIEPKVISISKGVSYLIEHQTGDTVVDFGFEVYGKAFLFKKGNIAKVYFQKISDTSCSKIYFYPPGDDFVECNTYQINISANENPVNVIACPSSNFAESKNCYTKKGKYDITGKKLNSSQKGIYIENGKKKLKVK
ncbi:MAG: hypothetical protein ABIL37_05655 [candidate division WOR-3 bacterium]